MDPPAPYVSVEMALRYAITASRMTRHEASLLHEYLALLAFKMTAAGYTGKLPKAVAAAWMRHLRLNHWDSAAQAARSELPSAARWWTRGVAAGLLHETEQYLAFLTPALQEYFCLHYCQTHPLQRKLLRLASHESFSPLWRRWAAQDPALAERLIALLLGSGQVKGCRHALAILRFVQHPQTVERLVAALSHPDGVVRIRAAQALLLLGDPHTLEWLTIRLKQEHLPAETPIIEALSSAGEPALPILIAWLGGLDRRLMVCIRGSTHPDTPPIVEALGRWGEPALPLLAELLWWPNNHILHASMRALGHTETPRAVAVLLNAPLLFHKSIMIQALSTLGEGAILPLVEAITPADGKARTYRDMLHPDMQREYIYAALRAMGDVRAAVLLLARLKQHASSVSGAWFGRALVMLHCPESADLLAEALTEQHIVVRWFAAWALAELGDRRAIMPLRQLVQEEGHPIMRRTAAEALKKLGEASD